VGVIIAVRVGDGVCVGVIEGATWVDAHADIIGIPVTMPYSAIFLMMIPFLVNAQLLTPLSHYIRSAQIDANIDKLYGTKARW
jgi:hypothetical protein